LDKQADDSAIDDMKFDLSNENNSQILAWNVCHNYNKQTDEELNEIVQRLVEPTQIGFETQAEMDEKVWLDFTDNIQQMDDGRYQVSLPWKEEEKMQLESNWPVAYHRMLSTLKALRKKPEFLLKYHDNLMELLALDIIEKVDNPTIDERIIHYMPHQVVIKPDSQKIRVYDGSSRPRKSALSINECLCRGPVLLPQIAGVLLRVRLKPYLANLDSSL